jgi:hypothetical protein
VVLAIVEEMERDEVDSVDVVAVAVGAVEVVDLAHLVVGMRRARLGCLAPSSADWLRLARSGAWTTSSCTPCQ